MDTPFRKIQAGLGAEPCESGGWSLPAHFGDPAAEHEAARNLAAVIDRSNAGRLKVTGGDRVDFLQRMCTQDLTGKVAAGRGAPAVFTTNKGRIIDLVSVFDLGDSILLLTSQHGRTAVPDWLRKYVLADDVVLTDMTCEGGAFRVTGPRAADVMSVIGDAPVSAIAPGAIAGVILSGIEAAIVGESSPRPSWLVWADEPGITELYEAACVAARSIGGGPAGESARTILRVEDGQPESGAELTEDFNPWEARLDEAVSLDKGCYVGQEVVARLNTYDKVSRRLVGLTFGDGPPPAAGSVLNDEGRERGIVTSAVRSLAAGESIGLGYVRLSHAEPGTALDVAAAEGASGDAEMSASVTGLPVVPAAGG